MATYKVIQDIEAEDKLVGPLTLRQFIYAAVAAVCLYICFLAFTRHAQFLVGLFLPIAALATFFAFPWKGEQPTEIWAMARLRFMVKPRVRIWDQDGARDIVTITAPKKVETGRTTRNLTQTEVRSRLKALADTIDSRGWATRNAAYVQTWNHPTVVPTVPNSSGLAASMPSDDMFDAQNSVAQNFDAMLAKSSQQQRQRVMQQMVQAQNPQPAVQPQPATAVYPQNAYQPYAADQAAAVFNQQTYYAQVPQPSQAPQLPAPVMPVPQQTQAAYPTYAEPQEAAYGAAPEAPQPATAYGAYGTQPGQPAGGYWFANGPAYPGNPAQYSTTPAPATVAGGRIESDMQLPTAPAPTPEEVAIAQNLKQQNQAAMQVNYSHIRVLQPLSGNPAGTADYPTPADEVIDEPVVTPAMNTQTAPQQPVTQRPDPAILELANNDDLDIATIARQAKKEIQKSPDEVEIRLH